MSNTEVTERVTKSQVREQKFMEHWVKTSTGKPFVKVGVWELEDGKYGLFVNGQQEPLLTYKHLYYALLHADQLVQGNVPKRVQHVLSQESDA